MAKIRTEIEGLSVRDVDRLVHAMKKASTEFSHESAWQESRYSAAEDERRQLKAVVAELRVMGRFR